MKVLAINGSPNRDGNTNELISIVLNILKNHGIETEVIQMRDKTVKGCIACFGCAKKTGRCTVEDDDFNDVYEKIIEGDGIIMGSPTYFTNVTAELKAVIDRAGMVSTMNDGMLKHKVGAAVVAVRRGGGIHAFDSINHLYQMCQMFVVGSTYWNLGFGMGKGEVKDDQEGVNNMKDLGESMAFLLNKIHG